MLMSEFWSKVQRGLISLGEFGGPETAAVAERLADALGPDRPGGVPRRAQRIDRRIQPSLPPGGRGDPRPRRGPNNATADAVGPDTLRSPPRPPDDLTARFALRPGERASRADSRRRPRRRGNRPTPGSLARSNQSLRDDDTGGPDPGAARCAATDAAEERGQDERPHPSPRTATPTRRPRQREETFASQARSRFESSRASGDVQSTTGEDRRCARQPSRHGCVGRAAPQGAPRFATTRRPRP